MDLSLQVAGKSDVGCVRSNNEDHFGYDARCGVFVVCDGMGGQAAGEVASRLAVDSVLEYFGQHCSGGAFPQVGRNFEDASANANALASAIQLANDAIFQSARSNVARHGMGSTIAAALVRHGGCSIAHVGDSRIYLIRDGSIRPLTEDHSLVMEQVRRGLITREEAERSEMQHIITRALGSDPSVAPDLQDVAVLLGDILLLATDGLTKTVSDARMLAIVQAAPSLEHACDELVSAARAAGGDDNITCLLVRIGGLEN
jgi:protein phosphatase